MEVATLNVRMSKELKGNGDAVLERCGISVSEAVRGLYEYLAREQKLPDFIATKEDRVSEKTRARREAFRQIIGIVPEDISLDDIRSQRLARQ